MHFQALFLILTIFVSYLILGGDNISSQEKAVDLATEPSFTEKVSEKISEKIVDIIVIANQGIDVLKQQASKLTALVKEAKQEKIEEISAQTIKDFKRLPPEEFDSQIVSYKANMEKTETDFSNDCENHLKEETSLKSRTALIKYIDYNFSLFEFNSQKRWPIASISKLMTSVIALEKLGGEKEIKISASAVATEGVTGGFKANETFKVEDLIKAMMMVSSNDAASALAEELDKEIFAGLMNQRAKELGMNDTYFEETTGLSFLNQSIANDLVKLATYIYNTYPQILEISRQKEAVIFELNSKKFRKLFNINRLAGQPDFLGGKTGYIDESGRNLVSFFNKNGKIILTVVLGAENAFDETKKMLNCYQ